MRSGERLDFDEWLARVMIGGMAAIAVLAIAACVIWKFRSGIMDDDAKAACRSRGGDVIPLAESTVGTRTVGEWQCRMPSSCAEGSR
jgi:hypothetical protein